LVEPRVAVKELPEPVTLAAGVPEPHWAETMETSASADARREKWTIVANSRTMLMILQYM
jgi:hypothetical protein